MLEIIKTLMDARKNLRVNFVGNTMAMCCPLHTEKTPSFTLDMTKKTYKCFGCNRRGSVDELFAELTSTSATKKKKKDN